MLLIERVPNEQLYLLIIMIISFILISHSIKNRPNLIKSIVLAHIKKTDFKFVLNNIQDRTTSILFLNSISLQALAICFFFEEKNFSSSQIIIALISAVIIKRALIKKKRKIFQKKKLFFLLNFVYCNGNSNRLGFGSFFFLQNYLSQQH